MEHCLFGSDVTLSVTWHGLSLLMSSLPPLPDIADVILAANRLLALRVLYAKPPTVGDVEKQPTVEGLQEETKKVDRLLTTHQRVDNRLGFAKKPTALDLQLHMTKTLTALHLTLRGILDVARFSVGLLSLFRRCLFDETFANASVSRQG